MVGNIWEDKWEYENFTYFVGDPLPWQVNEKTQEKLSSLETRYPGPSTLLLVVLSRQKNEVWFFSEWDTNFWRTDTFKYFPFGHVIIDHQIPEEHDAYNDTICGIRKFHIFLQTCLGHHSQYLVLLFYHPVFWQPYTEELLRYLEKLKHSRSFKSAFLPTLPYQ